MPNVYVNHRCMQHISRMVVYACLYVCTSVSPFSWVHVYTSVCRAQMPIEGSWMCRQLRFSMLFSTLHANTRRSRFSCSHSDRYRYTWLSVSNASSPLQKRPSSLRGGCLLRQPIQLPMGLKLRSLPPGTIPVERGILNNTGFSDRSAIMVC